MTRKTARMAVMRLMFMLVCGIVSSVARASPSENPELASPGSVGVGTTTATAGNISYRVWYPAARSSKAARIVYRHVVARPGSQSYPLVMAGVAGASAPVAAGRYPLIIMSHGYGGWATRFAGLAEHLASRGYVVAAINHKDETPLGAQAQREAFGRVLVSRPEHQRTVIADLVKRASTAQAGFAQAIDTRSIGIIGYSMGGYGALGTAGGCYDRAAPLFAQLPIESRNSLIQCTPPNPDIKALVLIAPWGGTPTTRIWAASALARVTVPTFIIGGADDDVVDQKVGVRWIYDSLTASDRWMLVYNAARHNIVGDTWRGAEQANFATREFLSEPVWRADRLAAINAHFVTAFVDVTLKGMNDRRAFLDVPVPDAGNGVWKVDVDATSGSLAGPGQTQYWRGFQRRWAIGVEMFRSAALGAESGQPAKDDR